MLVVDGAPSFLAEPGMFSGVRQRETVLSEEGELIDSESKNPGDVNWSDGKGRIVVFRNEGHVVVTI